MITRNCCLKSYTSYVQKERRSSEITPINTNLESAKETSSEEEISRIKEERLFDFPLTLELFLHQNSIKRQS